MILSIADVLSQTEVRWLREQLDAVPWREGAETAGRLARDVKRNRQADENAAATRRLSDFVLGKIAAHPQFVSAALPASFYPPKFNRYGVGETYGTHVDSAILRAPHDGHALRSDVSATLFLSEPEEYDGGVLEIDTQFGVQEVKLGAGALILYPSSSLHRVAPVLAGERLASFFWAQSMVRDTTVRSALYDLDHTIQALSMSEHTDKQDLVTLGAVYHNLLRVHADC